MSLCTEGACPDIMEDNDEGHLPMPGDPESLVNPISHLGSTARILKIIAYHAGARLRVVNSGFYFVLEK